MSEQVIVFHNGLEFWVTPERLPGSVNMFTALVSAVGEDPILKVVLAVHDPLATPADELTEIPKDVLDALYQQMINDVFSALQGIIDYDDLSKLESILGKYHL